MGKLDVVPQSGDASNRFLYEAGLELLSVLRAPKRAAGICAHWQRSRNFRLETVC
jgi:hypothetical protein